MALDVALVRGSGQEHEGCLLLTSEVLFVVSVSEDTQQQAFPVTEIDCAQDSKRNNLLVVQLKQPRVSCDVEVQFRKQGDRGWLPAKSRCGLAAGASGVSAEARRAARGHVSGTGVLQKRVGKAHRVVRGSLLQVTAGGQRDSQPGTKPPYDLTKVVMGLGCWSGQDRDSK